MTAAVAAGALMAAAAGLWSPDPGVGRRRLSFVALGWRGGARFDPTHRSRRWRQLAGASIVTVLAFGLRLAVVLALVLGIVVTLAARARIRRREAQARLAVVELSRAVAAELRAGRPPGAAFAAATEAAPSALRARLELAVVTAREGDADDLAAAISTAIRATPALAGLSRLVACWRVCAASGAMLAPAIDRVADALQDDIELAQTLDASLAGPRATVRLLAGLPVVGLLLGTAIGARPVAFLFGSTGGAGCLAAAVVFDVVGIAWSRRISSRALRVSATRPAT